MSSNIPNEIIMETGDTASLQNDKQNVHIQMKKAFNLVEESKHEIKLRDNYKDVILVLGITGTGKSTFTQWIVCDNSKLIAKDVGLGEILIYDDDRIGRSAINSKTIFPELVIDPITDFAFYDCPGFGDTRNTCYDLATTYFIKEVADHAKRIKMIFTLSYSSVREGENKKDFMSLMKNVSDFIKDVDKFQQSIAIVVTKVDNTVVRDGGSYKLVSDESIINRVAGFLMHVKRDLEENLKIETSTEKKCPEAAIKIINILLSRNENQYTKIGLFRRPDKVGPLSEIDSCQNAKKHIKKIIFEELDFAFTNNHSFGYGLSEKLKNDIYSITEDINEELWLKFDEIAVHIQKYFCCLDKDLHIKLDSFAMVPENVETAIKETRALLLKYRCSSSIIANLAERIKSLKEVEGVVRTINKELSNLSIVIPNEVISQLIDNGNYLNFLQILCEKILNTKQRSGIFKDTISNFDVWEKDLKIRIHTTSEKIGNRIRNTLFSLTEAMQEECRKKMKTLDVKSLVHKLQIDQATLAEKIKQIKNITATSELVGIFCECEKDLEICIPWKYLSILLNLGKCIHYLENLNKKQINAGLLAWSDALQDVHKFLQKSENGYKFLFELYDKLSEYKVQEDTYNFKKITYRELFGEDDLRDHEMNQVLELTLKDKPKVSFVETAMVIKGECITLKNIPLVTSGETITFSHKNEELFKLLGDLKTVCLFASSKIFIDQDVLLKGKGISFFFFAPTCEVIGTRKIDLSNDWAISGGFVFSICCKFLNFENLTIFTHNNQEVIDRPSNLLVNIIPCLRSNDTMDKAYNQSGAFKSDSKVGFVVGNVLVDKPSTLYSQIVDTLFKPTEKYTVDIFDHRAEEGYYGISKVIPMPLCKNFVYYITLFRYFLLSNISDRLKKSSVFQCLKLLDNSEIIANAYNAFEFYNELSLLVKEHPKLHKDVNFGGFYQSLLHRISHFNPELNSDYNPRESKKLLSAINYACLANINSLHYKYSSYLTEDINSHLNFTKNCIKGLKVPQTVEGVLMVSNKTSEVYKKNIDKKIEENKAINIDIFYEISVIKGRLDNKINKLLDEILSLQEQSEFEKQNLLNTKEELQDSIQLRSVITIVEKFYHIINVFEIVADEVSIMIQDRGLRMETLFSGNETTDIPPSYTSGILLKKEIEKIKNQNDARKIRELLEKIPITFENTFSKITNIEMANEFSQKLKQLEEKLKEQTSISKHKNSQILKIIVEYKTAAKFLAIGYDLYKQHKNDEAKIDIIIDSFEQVKINMEMLKLLKDKICYSVTPILEDIETDMDNSVQTLDGKSKISLDIRNWKVQGVLKDIQSHITRIKKGFKVCGGLAQYIEKLEESTVTMIHVYNHLQSYQEIQLLNDSRFGYYAVAEDNLELSDPKVAYAFKELHKVIDFSFLLKQYNILMDIFKQWVFPFGCLYKEHYELNLSSYGTWDKCVSEVIKKVKEMKELIIDQKTNTKSHENYIYSTDFQSGCVSTQPFFVWKKEQHGKIISELLSGQKVVVKADIMMSPLNRDAIKLICVDLYIRARDNDMQSTLNEALKKYEVRASHLGNSYYRCGERIYAIPTGSYTVEWSFEKSKNGEPIHKNSVYNMLQSGVIVLSPYAMWEIELLSCEEEANSFHELDIYKNQVDLELIGKGSYIDKKVDFSKLDLEKYYYEFLFHNY